MDQEKARTEAARIGRNARDAGIVLSSPDNPKLCELLAECRRLGVDVDDLLMLETA